MKRLLLINLLTVLVAPVVLATTNYINNSVVSVTSPPQIAPQIDASNFVNNGYFLITNFYSSLPYESWNTRNWTNASQMDGLSGFRFDYFDSVGQTNGWSANFQNAGSVNPNNSVIYGDTYLIVAATNLNNKGTMTVGGTGLISLSGKRLDLSRGTLGVVGSQANNQAGVQDLYWGTNETVFVPTASFRANSVQPPATFGTTIDLTSGFYVPILQSLRFVNPCGANPLCTNGYTAYLATTFMTLGGSNYLAYDVLFLRQTNAAISTEVRYRALPSLSSSGIEKMIQWRSYLTNVITHVVTTNLLYFSDTFGDWDVPPDIAQSPSPYPFSAARYRPINYDLGYTAPNGWNAAPTLAPTTVNPSIFTGTNTVVDATNTMWAATITAASYSPDPTIEGSTWTNVPGRIEVSASGPGSYLDLTRVIVGGQNYLLLSSTNHFVGSSNAAIVSPVSDVYLSSTNGLMTVSNLSTPFVSGMSGEVQAWSGRWTNLTSDGSFGLLLTVTVVDSALTAKTPAQIQNLSLRSTNLYVADTLNVFGSLLLDTLRLTISTNSYNAPTPYGQLNLTSGDILWSPSLPKLQCLTNFGQISSVNSIYFAGARTPPWFNTTFEEPYLSFVTHGPISSVACSIWANYFEASGTNNTGIGPLSVQASSAIVTNGAFLATDADISLTAGSLQISNQVLQAGRSISLTVTNYLDDGSLSNSVFVVTNKNIWTAGGGINLYTLPSQASLLATTITNTAFANSVVNDYWAGKDYGCWPNGFVNNAALGRLILDAQDSGSLFYFFRTGLTNALYVDLIEFKNGATNLGSSSVAGTLDVLGVNLDANFNIYYGDAIVSGKSAAEKLNGAYGAADTQGGRFLWVSNYNTGFFSSTNILYTNGVVHQLNRALVYSCDINSNGQPYPPTSDQNASCDGSILKPNPIPVLTADTLFLTASYTNLPKPSVVLSWNTIPLSSNAVFTSQSLSAPLTNWVLLTNFLSGPAIQQQELLTVPMKTNAPLYYRVRIQSP